KLPPYILPATPALAMMLGCLLDRVAFRPSSDGFLQRLRAKLPLSALVVLSTTWLVVSIGAGLLNLMGFWEVLGHASLAVSCLTVLALWRRKLPLRAAWAACCLLGTFLVFELTHALAPAWSQSHSPLTGSEQITRLLQDGQVGVVCYGGEWGSIPFYA